MTLSLQRFMTFLAPVAAAVVLAGCLGGGAARQAAGPQRYDLGALPAASGGQAPSHGPIALSLDASPTLSETGMLWRVADSAAPHAYAQARWVSPPANLIRQRLVELLSRSGPVVTESVVADVRQLRLTITQFEQVFSPDGSTSEGRIAMQALLLQDRKVIASTRFDVSAPAATQDAEGGVQALRQALDKAASELAYWIAVQGASARTK